MAIRCIGYLFLFSDFNTPIFSLSNVCGRTAFIYEAVCYLPGLTHATFIFTYLIDKLLVFLLNVNTVHPISNFPMIVHRRRFVFISGFFSLPIC